MRIKEFIFEYGESRKLNPQQVEEIVNLYKSGFSMDDIASDYQISATTIYNFLKARQDYTQLRQANQQARVSQGLKAGKKGTTPEQVQQMAQMFITGESFEAIGKQFNIDNTLVARYLRRLPNFAELQQQQLQARAKLGLQNLPPGSGPVGITSVQVQQMAQKFAAGQEQRVIAKEYNVTYNAVNYWLRQLPNYNELKQQNVINRRKQRGQAVTKRNVSKPMSKGNQAINKSGPLVK